MKQKLLQILINPLVIAIIISMAIIAIMPKIFSKYNVEFVSNTNAQASKVYFEDLNGDARSEALFCKNNTSGNASFTIKDYKGLLIDQYNFKGELLNLPDLLSFGDINNNGFKEVYLITKKEDSVFLNIVEPYKDNGISEQISIVIISGYTEDYQLWATDIIVNQNQDILFTLNSGFGGTLRNAFKYNLLTKTLTKSPHLTNRSGIEYNSYKTDDKHFIITISSCNKIDSVYTNRSDCSSWLQILNSDLDFEFEPIEFKHPYSSTQPFPINLGNKEGILSLVISRDSKSKASYLYVHSLTGEQLLYKELPLNQYYIFQNLQDSNFSLYNTGNGQIQTVNSNLEITDVLTIDSNSYLHYRDINNDQENEWIAFNKFSNEITIYKSNFNHPTTFNTQFKRNDSVDFSIRQLGESQNQIVLQKDDTYLIYNFGNNPLYSLRFPLYLAIFLSVLGFIWIIGKAQEYKVQKKLAIEKEIMQLQLKTIKNQVDPHFVFNAINTISEMTLMDNKLEADKFISRFSGFMRDTLNHSDKIVTNLQEEIDYTENFIKLQQIRYNYSFNYKVEIDKDVNREAKVPKHVLFCYVENAIKHGLAIKKEGILKIKVYKQEQNLVLTIEDNGGGISLNKNKSNSTGSGLQIMNKIYDLFSKIRGNKIHHTVIELKDDSGNINGLRVEIMIENKKQI